MMIYKTSHSDNPWINKRKKKVEAGGMIFDSIADAARYFRVSAHLIRMCIKERRELIGHKCIPNYVSNQKSEVVDVQDAT